MNDEPLDYYAILGVSREATEVDIKAAYHRQALRLHPDRNKDNEERANLDFKKVAEAYRVLSNSESKAAFDRHGHLKMHKLSHSDIFNTFSKIFGSENKSATFSFQNQGSTFSDTSGRKRPRPEFTSTPSITQHLADYFASISSGNIPGTVAENESEPPTKKPRFDLNGNNDSGFFSSGSSSSYTLGQTLQTTLDVTFDESVHGCTKHILIIRQDICLSCRGTGFTDINSNSNSGEYATSPAQNSPRAPRARSMACRECSNSGRVPREKQIRVDVPAGVIDGWKKIYKGEGDAPPKELGSYSQDAERLSYGNLIVVFKVESHPFLRRDPSNLLDVNCELPITFSQAAVGACLQIPTIYGSATIDIPSGTQPGTVIHLHKQGFTSLHDNSIRGDMHIKIALMVPSTLSAKQIELLQAFEQETENAHHNISNSVDKKNEDRKESN